MAVTQLAATVAHVPWLLPSTPMWTEPRLCFTVGIAGQTPTETVAWLSEAVVPNTQFLFFVVHVAYCPSC